MRFRFAEQDHDRYGDAWYAVNIHNPGDIDAGILEEWEEATGFLLFSTFYDALETRSFKALRATAWLAYRIGGGPIGWDDFRPQTHLLVFEHEAGDGAGEGPGPNRATRRATPTRSKAGRSANTSATTTSP